MSMLRFRLQLLTSRARLCQNISWIQFASPSYPNTFLYFGLAGSGMRSRVPNKRIPGVVLRTTCMMAGKEVMMNAILIPFFDHSAEVGKAFIR